MIDRRARPSSSRVALARVLFAVCLAFTTLAVPASATFRADEAQAAAGRTVARPGASCLAKQLNANLQAYLRAHRRTEHVSAAGLSVSLRGHRSSIDVSAGTTRFRGPRSLDSSALWQIGSNTKAFTSVLVLQLEAEHRLSINDTLGTWVPRYPQWRDVTIKRLLNMTSGIPTYDAQPSALATLAAHPYRYFTRKQLISYVVGAKPTTGFSYSNTNYVLLEEIIEKAGGKSYRDQLYTRLIEPLGLHDVYYRTHLYPPQVTAREPAGYFFIREVPPALQSLVGRDVSRFSLSWARGAGGILSTTHDMTVWERALYGGRLLPRKQQAELTSLISTATGKPIKRTSPQDPSGFGLGVAQGTDPKLGTFWLYEGGTLGFRTLHIYFPRSGVIMAMGLNSYPSQDRITALALSTYDTLVANGIIRRAGGPTTRRAC